MASTSEKRPAGCPLFHHGNGQWARKVRGRLRYFGTDLDAALKRWAAEKDHLLAGLDPPRLDGEPTVAELGNLYLADCRQRIADGKVRGDHTLRVMPALQKLIDGLGGSARLTKATPTAWSKVRRLLDLSKDESRRMAPATVKADAARCRAFLNWVKRQRLVAGEIHHAGALDPPAKRELRIAKSAMGSRLWDAGDLRATIEAASVQFKPVLLLAINAAFGIADIAAIKRSQIRPSTEYLDLARNKTGVPRRVWLWPETREAIAVAVAKRAEPHRQRFVDRLLLTPRGLPWHRIEDGRPIDSGCSELRRTVERAGLTTPRTLYDCRRTFRTVASAVCDLEAINCAMGHEGSGEGTTYMQGISDDRIRRVCDHVRQWLFGV